MKKTSDIVRQAGVLVLALLAIAAAAVGSGAFGGTPTSEAADGALSATATPLAPAAAAFSIWSVIYLGLIAYAVWQLLPAQRTNERQRQMGWLAAASMVLNAAWLLVVQVGILWLSVVVIVVLLGVLVQILLVLLRTSSGSLVERVVVDGTFGLYLGWVTIATIANIVAALTATDVGDLVLGATGWSVVLLVAAAAIGVAFAVSTGGRITPSLALAWGLAWVAVGRWSGEPENATVAVAAAIAAVLTLGAGVVMALRTRAGTPSRA
ncbi:tryptophan-rich sensory protein [Sanguibacter antarcticus]|uniref:TspO/MBR related protein n=1 Tax=Sanguibacter antarcticus TaxID=372484 RepID=A0A2A9E7W0_9MICO|nr:tryptophan-rich sensory protein [Sanguibacter antarcticus]PFG34319.1 TspO/MBR related protein [Sanguibacter antarcticus]